MERYKEQNVRDVMVLGWSEAEARQFDSTERKELAATSRQIQRQLEARAKVATTGR